MLFIKKLQPNILKPIHFARCVTLQNQHKFTIKKDGKMKGLLMQLSFWLVAVIATISLISIPSLLEKLDGQETE